MRLQVACEALALLGALVGCSSAPGESVGIERERTIYDLDDRRDVYEVTEPNLRALALGTSMALLDPASLTEGNGTVTLHADTLGTAFRLCDGEAFESQPSAARCSGVLVADDLILTAGHCMDEVGGCEQQTWALGYAVVAEGESPHLAPQNLYRCASILARRSPSTSVDSGQVDHAFVRLDRNVSPAPQFPPISAPPAQVGAALSVIGYPSGLPAKIDSGARVVDAERGAGRLLALTSDTFGGSSGSGVYDASGGLLAVMLRGGVDYEYQLAGDCFTSTKITTSTEPLAGEEAEYVATAIDALCASGERVGSPCSPRAFGASGGCSVGRAPTSGRPACAMAVGGAVGIGRRRRRKARTSYG